MVIDEVQQLKLKPTFIGFEGPVPYAIIFWSGKYKTVCYDELEYENALSRHKTPGDFYYKLEPSIYFLESDGSVRSTAEFQT
ncbi:hypothetical protein SFC08_01975 [Lysinibacillus halotolerans]